MKKIAFSLMIGLCAGFAACDDFEEPNPEPQTNPQEPVLSAEDVIITKATGLQSGVINLTSYNDSNSDVPMFQVDSVVNCPAGYGVDFKAYVSKDADFTQEVEIPTVNNDGLIGIAPDAWQGAHQSLYGKNPKERESYVRFAGYLVSGKTSVRLGSADYYYMTSKVNVTPFASSFVIEDNYYLLGTINGWSVAEAIKFNHSDLNPYDDPVFTLNVEISDEDAANGWWWKIVPESTYVTGNWADGDDSQFGPAENGDESLSGMLMGKTAGKDPGAGCIKQAGAFIITINMEEQTYEFTPAAPYLYVVGDCNGWSFGNNMLLSTTNYTDYEGYAYLTSGGFKFTNSPDWGHTNFGDGGEAGKLSTDGGAGNLAVAENGLYWCHVNIVDLTYSLTKINTIGVIGSATPKGWDGSTALTPSDDWLTWTGTVHFGEGEYKFRANDDWGVNLGGDLGNLTQGGPNIASPGEGDYDIVLHIGTPVTATVTKK